MRLYSQWRLIFERFELILREENIYCLSLMKIQSLLNLPPRHFLRKREILVFQLRLLMPVSIRQQYRLDKLFIFAGIVLLLLIPVI